MTEFWRPGNMVAWRGIYRNRIWYAQTAIVVKDTPEETVLARLPGAQGRAEQDYVQRKRDGRRRWDFQQEDWILEDFPWHTNRLLFLLEPDKYYSTIFFWSHKSNSFLGYYINFQLPFKRSKHSIDTLDLELDINVHPDFSFEWKDVDDYQKGIETGIILPEWVQGVEMAKTEILEKLEKRQYPFDGSWLDWLPDPNWTPPQLPENWDKI
jgi:predicted RNA-binding protein associated with RNAse of E/G family